MSMRKYVLTGRGSITRWEHPDGRPVGLGTIPPDALLVRHQKGENDELILSDEFAQKPGNAHFKLVPVVAGSITTDPKAPVTEAVPAPRGKASKPTDAAASSNLG